MSANPSSQLPLPHNQELKCLVNSLRAWGIDYVMDGPRPTSPLPAVELVMRLARCEYSQVRNASIALFLLRPELAGAVLEAYNTCDPSFAEQIAVLTLATIYLQRQWSFRLAMALGRLPAFPEQQFAHLWQCRMLPPPACQYGEIGLLALQELEQRRQGWPLDFIGDWQKHIEYLLLQEEAKHYPVEAAVAVLSLSAGESEGEEEPEVYMSQEVGKAEIERFLGAVGQVVRHPARLYLSGETALIHMGTRAGATMNVEVVLDEAGQDEMLGAMQMVVDHMQIRIELAAPGDLIPLPAQCMTQARYVGRYGSVDVFYFDFYSLALSKIARGADRDLMDVKLLLQQKVITLEGLDATCREVLPRIGNPPHLNPNLQRFAERYAIVCQQFQHLF